MNDASQFAESNGGPSSGSMKERLEQIIDLLYRRKWIVLAAVVVITAVAAYRTYSETPVYRTTSVVMVDLERTSTATSPNMSAPMQDLFSSGGRTLAAELFIIENSPTIRERVSNRLRALVNDPEARDSLGLTEASWPARGTVNTGLAGREVDAIQFISHSPFPREAAVLANLYAEEYVRLTQDASRTYVSASREFLEEQEQQRAEDLRLAEQKVQQYRQQQTSISLDNGGSSIVQQIASMEAARDEALVDLTMRRSSLKSIEDQITRIEPKLLARLTSSDDQKLQVLQSKLAELELQRTDYLSQPGRSISDGALAAVNNDIASLEQEIASLAKQLMANVEGMGGALNAESGLAYATQLRQQAAEHRVAISGAEARTEVLNRRINELQRELNGLPSQLVQLAWLERDRLHAEQMYSYVISRLQEVRVNEVSEPGYAYVLRDASPPGAPVSPNKSKDISYGLLFGILAGFGLALLLDRIDNRLYKPNQLVTTTRGNATLSVIPDLGPIIKEELGGQPAIMMENGMNVSSHLVSLHLPFSAATEAYRQLRTMLCFGSVTEDPRIISVTSANPSEGKTTTAGNLAVLLAQSGFRTILIDGDMRRPHVHELFGVPEQGIDTFAGLLEAQPQAFTPTPSVIEGLDILTSGLSEKPAELLTSVRLYEMLGRIAEDYHYVVVDTPPVLAATDAAIIAKATDVTVMVCMAAKTKEADLDVAFHNLQSVGANVAGVVLNRFRPDHALGYKYRHDGYSAGGYYGNKGYTYGARPKV